MDKVINSLGHKDKQLEQLKSETKDKSQAINKIFEIK
mgnify:CR=1 FL=1